MLDRTWKAYRMIKVRYNDTDSIMLRISGHADYAEAGKDIVCAGVSAITYALLGYLEKIDKTVVSDIKDEEGYICIVSNSIDKRVESAFDMALLGLRQIELAYPNHVSVKK